MEITFNDLLVSREALQVIARKNMPVKPALAIARHLKVVDDALREFDTVRESLVANHGTPGVPLEEWDEDSREEFIKKMNEALTEKVEVDIKPVPVRDMGESFEVEPVSLAPLLTNGFLKD